MMGRSTKTIAHIVGIVENKEVATLSVARGISYISYIANMEHKSE